ncbi:hypothetical protein GQ53DRAFT_725580 [Thozetella sp. PMI_491]|nr:hypothetical protein GQ53DRAFT_725580 [Thozetella sp. PMI_491]
MSDNTTDFDPQTQVIILLAADGVTPIPIPLSYINWLYLQGFASEINYGSQIGASFIMLLVVLLMTPRNRFARTPTLINLAGLATNLVRCLLLSVFFTSSWMDFYTVMSGDITFVLQNDFLVSLVATAFGIPVLVLIEVALAVQAWSLIKLWPGVYKWPTTAISALVAFGSVALKLVDVIVQCRFIVHGGDLPRWPRVADLALSTASISWFCFLFMIRLVLHMYTHRSILPSAKGLSAMEVLVMTNGVLMLIPVLFAGLEWGTFVNFESGSLTHTSVFIVLPLGSLVAQRIANPGAFSVERVSSGRSSGRSSNKQPFLKSWHSSITAATKGVNRHGVTTHVASTSHQEKTSDAFSDLDHVVEDLEHGVRVNRQIEHHEQLTL